MNTKITKKFDTKTHWNIKESINVEFFFYKIKVKLV